MSGLVFAGILAGLLAAIVAGVVLLSKSADRHIAWFFDDVRRPWRAMWAAGLVLVVGPICALIAAARGVWGPG